jgi:hypothetical protein
MATLLQPSTWKNTTNLLRKGWLNLDSYVKKMIGLFDVNYTPYPFNDFPEPQVTDLGPAYIYMNNFTLNKFKVKGVFLVQGSSSISYYIGTIKMRPLNQSEEPFIWPGKLTGMVMASEDNLFITNTDKITSPLAIGAAMWDIDAATWNDIIELRMMLYTYGEADPETNEVNYALVFEAYAANPTIDLSAALISYEYEFLAPSNTTITLWQD